MDQRKLSKKVSFWLRHGIAKEGLPYEPDGFFNIGLLIEQLKDGGLKVEAEDILNLIEGDGRERFTISNNGKSIKANYGHSFDIVKDEIEESLPKKLYLTIKKGKENTILEDGFNKVERKKSYFFESKDKAGAKVIDGDTLVLLEIDMGRLSESERVLFTSSGSGIWEADLNIRKEAISYVGELKMEAPKRGRRV